MAPKTRTRQRKERRKWIRHTQQQQQQQQQQPPPLVLDAMASLPWPATVEDASTDAPFAIAAAPAVTNERDAIYCRDNTNTQKKKEHTTKDPEHPRDCVCLLRKKTRGTTFIPRPPPSLHDLNNTGMLYYCSEIKK